MPKTRIRKRGGDFGMGPMGMDGMGPMGMEEQLRVDQQEGQALLDVGEGAVDVAEDAGTAAVDAVEDIENVLGGKKRRTKHRKSSRKSSKKSSRKSRRSRRR